MRNREIITTGDGSKTIYMPDWNEHYHSRHGALQEALHVFIKMGMDVAIPLSRKRNPNQPKLSILEYGLGTGLNAMLTAQHKPEDLEITYTAVEAYPVSNEEIAAMDYGNLLNDLQLYETLHACPWEQSALLANGFKITKQQKTFDLINDPACYDLIYFDAFGPRVQPDLWSLEIFEAAYKSLNPSGILTTYCAAGFVRRNMQAAGFIVERLAGPPGKREMLRATKA